MNILKAIGYLYPILLFFGLIAKLYSLTPKYKREEKERILKQEEYHRTHKCATTTCKNLKNGAYHWCKSCYFKWLDTPAGRQRKLDNYYNKYLKYTDNPEYNEYEFENEEL